jgi:hypothetical protein
MEQRLPNKALDADNHDTRAFGPRLRACRWRQDVGLSLPLGTPGRSNTASRSDTVAPWIASWPSSTLMRQPKLPIGRTTRPSCLRSGSTWCSS